jgi:putative membrane protein
MLKELLMMRNRWFGRFCLAVVAAAALGPPTRAAAALDDATILAIFDQANAADIVTGRLGAKYGASEEVRALGRMVASDHAAVQQTGRDLAWKLKIVPTPPDNDTSAADLARAVALLQSKTGAEFDKAYLQYEVAFHQSVVDAIKGTLLPAIKNDELRNLMKSVLPGFEQHLAATRAVARKRGVL